MKKLKDNLIKLNETNRLYQIPVPIIGLTGGIGAGKSTVTNLFLKKGIPVIDADKNVKSIYQLPETLNFIKTHFPEAITNEIINFKKIREIVFVNPDARILLEQYIYSHMPNEFKSAFYAFNNPTFVVYDVPLLFEKQLNLLVDFSICVYAPRELQIERIMTRDHCSKEMAENILSNQLNIEEKRKLSDFVLSNTGSLSDLENQFENLLNQMTL